MKNAAAPTTTTTTPTASDHHVPNPQSDTQFPKLQSHSDDQRKTQPPHPNKKKKKNWIPIEKDISTHESQVSDGSGTPFSLTWKENKKESTAQLINKTKQKYLLLLLLLQKGETQEMKEYNQLRRSEGGWGRRSCSQETTRDRHQN
jgi:hypothetical protein